MPILNFILLIFSVFGLLFSAVNPPKFKKTILTSTFVSEGVCIGDVNKDGKKDIIAGAYWFEAPRWTQHQFTTELRYNKSLKAFPEGYAFKVDEGYSDSFANFSADINHDGWVDVIKIGLPGEAIYWLENNHNKPGFWKRHDLYTSLGNESPLFEDVNGDGRRDLIGNDSKNKQVIWLEAPGKKETTWVAHVISSNPTLGTHKYTHGLGFADLNKDGRKDVIIKEGWWEMPKDLRLAWTFHPLNLKYDCSQIYLQDFDGDGDLDILTSSAHDYGTWWHEIKNLATGEVETHEIQRSLSQTHSLQQVDVNGDGQQDFITGKRYMAHNGKDPGEFEKALLVWYEFKPTPSPTWVEHVFDEDSGAGIQFFVEDMNKDKKSDLVLSNKKGVFLFEKL